jgi:hypothetical protein
MGFDKWWWLFIWWCGFWFLVTIYWMTKLLICNCYSINVWEWLQFQQKLESGFSCYGFSINFSWIDLNHCHRLIVFRIDLSLTLSTTFDRSLSVWYAIPLISMFPLEFLMLYRGTINNLKLILKQPS